MKMTSRSWSRGFTLSLVVGTVLACSGTIREDVFLCENAVSHLQECCPNFGAPIACNYDPGCLDSTYPDLDTTQSNCILGEPCDILRQNGLCQIAVSTPQTDDGTSPPVCTQPALPVDAAPPAATVGVACTSASDCVVPGQMCCVTSLLGDRTCVSTTSCPVQACVSTSECGPGKVCGARAPFASVCVVDDASTAIPDAESIAPDATDAQSEEEAAADGGFTQSDAADAMSDAPVDAGGE